MRTFLLLLASVSVTLSFQGDAKELSLVDTKNFIPSNRQSSDFDPNVVFFMLFTRQNPTIGQRITFDVTNITNSHFNAAFDVRVLVHGYVSSYQVAENNRTTAEFLSRGDYNVIAVDYSAISFLDYATARAFAKDIGNVIGSFIDFLQQNNFTQHSRVNIIGHSLGGQVSGFAGKATVHGKVNCIFATDPAQPLFSIDEPENRLDINDAVYTEAIITSSVGFRLPIARATFYANYGIEMPGCNGDSSCNHHRATEYYSESINNDLFIAQQCTGYDEIVAENCSATGIFAMLGGDQPKNISGVFYIKTNAESPYASNALTVNSLQWLYLIASMSFVVMNF